MVVLEIWVISSVFLSSWCWSGCHWNIETDFSSVSAIVHSLVNKLSKKLWKVLITISQSPKWHDLHGPTHSPNPKDSYILWKMTEKSHESKHSGGWKERMLVIFAWNVPNSWHLIFPQSTDPCSSVMEYHQLCADIFTLKNKYIISIVSPSFPLLWWILKHEHCLGNHLR